MNSGQKPGDLNKSNNNQSQSKPFSLEKTLAKSKAIDAEISKINSDFDKFMFSAFSGLNGQIAGLDKLIEEKKKEEQKAGSSPQNK